MFHISDGRQEFYQWDVDRKVTVEDATINQVHFCNKTDDCSLVVEVYEQDGIRYANVPNILLQDTWDLNVYGYDVNYTKHHQRFAVLPRTKPETYVYTEVELVTYEGLQTDIDILRERVDKLSGIDSDGNVIDLTQYPTRKEMTEAIDKAKQSETQFFQDYCEANFYTKEDIDAMLPASAEEVSY